MKKIIFILACLALTISSCDDWLDIKPKTNVEEEDLFRNEQGFKEALTGIYIRMSEPDLYGREMTYGFMDILAQRYFNNENPDADYHEETWYTYPSVRTEGYTNKFWTVDYNLIANLNNLIRNIDLNGQVIRESYRDIIKGEALGLRSFLYFDLLRMYGPIYKENASSPAIPYRTQFNREVAKLLPASAVADSIIVSLQQAEKLLENDPMNIAFPVSPYEIEDIDPFLNYRFNRMNKYAVKAELARVFLWKGDKANAYKYAKEVVEGKNAKGGRQFNLVTDNAQDPLCSTELIFSLSMDSKYFKDRIQSEYQIAMWNFYVILGNVDRLYQIFDTANDGQNDMRMKSGLGFDISAHGASCLKYRQENLASYAMENNMPLIRLPEMYYIMAECTSDMQEAASYISLVRGARGVDEVNLFKTEEERMNHIEKEYRKEFYAEGQLWYFYKRQAYKTFMFCPIANMTEKNYRFSIPDDEVALGDIN